MKSQNLVGVVDCVVKIKILFNLKIIEQDKNQNLLAERRNKLSIEMMDYGLQIFAIEGNSSSSKTFSYDQLLIVYLRK